MKNVKLNTYSSFYVASSNYCDERFLLGRAPRDMSRFPFNLKIPKISKRGQRNLEQYGNFLAKFQENREVVEFPRVNQATESFLNSGKKINWN